MVSKVALWPPDACTHTHACICPHTLAHSSCYFAWGMAQEEHWARATVSKPPGPLCPLSPVYPTSWRLKTEWISSVTVNSHGCFSSAFSSVYQIVVEEERPRRAKKTTEILKCYPVPIHFQNASLLNSQYYFAAEFPADSLQAAQPFTIGDNRTYNGYWNTPLLPHKSYRIYYQAASRANGVSVGDVCGLGSFLMVFMYAGVKWDHSETKIQPWFCVLRLETFLYF